MSSSHRANHARRARARGVTLIEVMIVVVILGLISAGVAIAVFAQLKKAQKETTVVAARTLRSGAEVWRSGHSDGCPTPQVLVHENVIDRGSKLSDAWNTPFKIVCEESGTSVLSYGPDKKEGTDDDMKVPGGENESS